MIITNIDINDLESIFSIQESVFKEEPLLTGLEYFKHVTSRDDLKVYFEKYDFITVCEDGKSVGEDLFTRGVCLPSDTKMTVEEQNEVIRIIKSLFI